MRWEILTTGYCTHPDLLILRGATCRVRRFPATLVYIEHPRHGRILFDTGYSMRFFDATRRFPERLYALTTPVTLHPEETAASQLARRGIDPADIDHVIVSHFHADHIGGAADFPAARYWFLPDAYSRVTSWSRRHRVRGGFLKDLLPPDFARRASPIESRARTDIPCLAGILPGHDIFGDGSLVAVPLPGHAPGHMGLWIRGDAPPALFVSDAVWLIDQLTGHLEITPLARLVMDDGRSYHESIRRLRELRNRVPEVPIIPCHCAATHGDAP